MRITDSKGNVVSTLGQWENCVRPEHWEKCRSAYSLADFIMNRNGAAHLKSRISFVLSQPVTFEVATPEYQARFDSYEGNPSNLDLGITGHIGSRSSLFVGVEAKVDEPFGPTVIRRYEEAIKTRKNRKSTNADRRVEDLLSHYFSDTDDPCSSRFAGVGYQLLTGTAGTVRVGKDISVFYVLVFKTSKYSEPKGLKNKKVYEEFIQAAGGKPLMQDGKKFRADELTLSGKQLTCIYDRVSTSS